MARVKGPLMSMDATGIFAREMCFRHQSGQVVVYRHGAPGARLPVRPSPSQAQVRARFAEAKARWLALAPERRAAWRTRAHELGRGRSGWNCYLSWVLTGGEGMDPHGPVLAPAALYRPPCGALVLFPDVTWVADQTYTPPAPREGFISWPTATP